MSEQSIAILADDLTGACDAVAPFASETCPGWVTWKLTHIERNAAALSVCTNSRACDATTAVERSRQGARTVRDARRRRIFLKMDSTLKGHWAQEIRAVMDELRLKTALVAPAYPAMGRCIVDGRLQLGGTIDAHQRSLATILQENGQDTAIQISSQELQKSAVSLARLIALDRSDKCIFGFDTREERDLEAVAEIVELLADAALPVGSRGLTGCIAKRMNELNKPPRVENQGDADSIAERPPVREEKPVLIVSGSNNPVTESQLTAMAEGPPVSCFDLRDATCSQISGTLHGERHVVVRLNWRTDHTQHIDKLIEVCQDSDLVGMILTGGDTAQLVCDRCGADGLWIEGEVTPGLPCGRFDQGRLSGVRVVTKAGGFGDTHAILCAVRWLRTQE